MAGFDLDEKAIEVMLRELREKFNADSSIVVLIKDAKGAPDDPDNVAFLQCCSGKDVYIKTPAILDSISESLKKKIVNEMVESIDMEKLKSVLINAFGGGGEEKPKKETVN